MTWLDSPLSSPVILSGIMRTRASRCSFVSPHSSYSASALKSGWMDGRMGEQVLWLTSRPFTTPPPRCISTGKEGNVLWSPLSTLVFVCLSEHRLLGCAEKETLPGFALHPHSTSSTPSPFLFDLLITTPSIRLIPPFLLSLQLQHITIKWEHIFKRWD